MLFSKAFLPQQNLLGIIQPRDPSTSGAALLMTNTLSAGINFLHSPHSL